MDRSAREVTEQFLDDARTLLRRDGDLIPIALVEGSDNVLCALAGAFDGATQADRAELMWNLGVTIGFGFDAKRLVVVADTYMSEYDMKGKSKEDIDIDSIPAPSEDPNRIECIVVQVQNPDGLECMAFQKYYRRDSGIEFPEATIVEGDEANKLEDYTFKYFFLGMKSATEKVDEICMAAGVEPDFVFEDSGHTALEHTKRAARRAAVTLFGAEIYSRDDWEKKEVDNAD